MVPPNLARSFVKFRVRNSLLPLSSFDLNVPNTETHCKFCGIYDPDEFQLVSLLNVTMSFGSVIEAK